MTFCNDIDLLHWEPGLFAEAGFASQQLLTGTGNLAGTAFTISSGSLIDAHVTANQVIILSGAVGGCFPIVSVNTATQLTLSVLYDGLDPDGGDPRPGPVGTSSGLAFAIRTFWPQRKVVSDILRAAAGLDRVENAAHRIVNTAALRRPAALGTLQLIYGALAAAVTSEPNTFAIRAALYARLYRRALNQTRIELDTDGDGEADLARDLGVLTLDRR